MSFNISTGPSPVTADVIASALGSAYGGLSEELHTAEHDAMAEAAALAAADLAATCGPGPFTVTVSGHANSGHEKRQGWSDTHLTVSISAVLASVEDGPTRDGEATP